MPGNKSSGKVRKLPAQILRHQSRIIEKKSGIFPGNSGVTPLERRYCGRGYDYQ